MCLLLSKVSCFVCCNAVCINEVQLCHFSDQNNNFSASEFSPPKILSQVNQDYSREQHYYTATVQRHFVPKYCSYNNNVVGIWFCQFVPYKSCALSEPLKVQGQIKKSPWRISDTVTVLSAPLLYISQYVAIVVLIFCFINKPCIPIDCILNLWLSFRVYNCKCCCCVHFHFYKSLHFDDFTVYVIPCANLNEFVKTI